MNKKFVFLWFIIGLGSGVRLVASLTLAEAVVLASAFFVIPTEYHYMERNGVASFFVLSLMLVAGCILAIIVNQTRLFFALRGLAVTSILACSIPFSHYLLRNYPNGFKWMLVGFLVCTLFRALQADFFILLSDDVDAFSLKGLIRSFLMIPVQAWYMQLPLSICILAPIAVVLFSMTKTVSGRGTALGCIAFTILVLIGKHSPRSMRRVCQHFWKFVLGGMVLVILLNGFYGLAANKGWLGERGRRKYVTQTQGENSIGRLLLGGRAAAFVGLLGCRDHPIIGMGPWALDNKGYREEFIVKYGTDVDVAAIMRNDSAGKYNGLYLIPCHSHITECWLWYGIFGLLFWVYLFFVFMRYLKEDCYIVPQWFAWVACSIPGLMWDIAFNPLSNRIYIPMIGVACLIVRAVRRGRVILPGVGRKIVKWGEQRETL